ncbi:hypothetical protein ACFP81_13310 [Deinococcus lacus]|uniref:Uncharacterized protein n=1 Tax=Deinococcus lacus TaxID=392561 RepID=A0ABW1YI57_9DEIO
MKTYERSLLLAVTSSVSLGFLRGQVRRLAERGWRTGVAAHSAVPGALEAFTQAEGGG